MSPMPYFVIFVACLVAVAHRIFPAREHLALLTTLGLNGSMLALVPLFFGWWKGKGKRVIHGFLIFYTWLLCLWMLASLGLYQERGRALTLSELQLCFQDRASRQFALDLLLSTKVLIYTIIYLAVLAGLFCLMRKLNGIRTLFLMLMVMLGVQQAAQTASKATVNGFSSDYIQSVICPWPGLALELNLAETVRTDKPQAISYKDISRNKFWELRPTQTLSELHHRYPKRSFIAIVMESQRLSDCEPRETGAHGGHYGLTPRLKELSKSGIRFTNVIQSGTHTNTMAWPILTGLPNPRDFQGTTSSPFLGELSRSLDFRNSGYSLQWIQGVETDFCNLGATLDFAGFKKQVDPEETNGMDQTNWTAWGFPDDQIFAIAQKRIAVATKNHEPYLIIINTISNHSPFKFPPALPDGTKLPADHVGGTLYADWCLGIFIDQLKKIPEEVRPIVWITADHSHLDGLQDHPVTSEECLERMRLPGLLLLPDNYGAGLELDVPFSHEDVLDLAYHLTHSPTQDKFLKYTRVAIASIINDQYAIVTPSTAYFGSTKHAYAIHGQWGLTKNVDQTELDKAIERFHWVSDFSDRLWMKSPE
ncbi:MAG: sulfatase-like hydrolase/transferase [Verrucomicrobia bacterium]|nr:sulfatase-like hydrolase/transferase [Verrucomicrobiota bacterium]